MSRKSRIRKAVVPAAGLGLRMLPISKSVPKEMLPLVDTPVIQYVVEEAAASGIETVIFVINDSRTALVRHFAPAPALEDCLAESGGLREAASLRRLSRRLEMRFVRQAEPRGVGDAIACAAAEVGDEPFAVLLADNVIDADVPCIRQLMDAHQAVGGCLVAAREIDAAQSSSFGVLLTEALDRSSGRANAEGNGRLLRVRDLVEKPAAGMVGSGFGVYGRYVLEPEIFSCLRSIAGESPGEIQLTAALSLLCRQGGMVHMLRFAGEHYDTGDKFGFIKASIAFGLKHPEVAPRLRQYLRGLAANG